MVNEEKEKQRREAYERQCAVYTKKCKACRASMFPPPIERCNDCTTGRKLHMLEVEYADVTGWSHETWKKDQTR